MHLAANPVMLELDQEEDDDGYDEFNDRYDGNDIMMMDDGTALGTNHELMG